MSTVARRARRKFSPEFKAEAVKLTLRRSARRAAGGKQGTPDPPAQVRSTERAKRHRSRSRAIASARPASSRGSSQSAISSASHR